MKKQMRWLLYAMNFLASHACRWSIPRGFVLSKLGYTVVQRGYILAANAVVAIAGQFLFGYLCDRFQRVKVFFFAAYVLLTASSFAMFLVERQTFWYHVFTVALMGGMVKVIVGLDETWDAEMIRTRAAAGKQGTGANGRFSDRPAFVRHITVSPIPLAYRKRYPVAHLQSKDAEKKERSCMKRAAAP